MQTFKRLLIPLMVQYEDFKKTPDRTLCTKKEKRPLKAAKEKRLKELRLIFF